MDISKRFDQLCAELGRLDLSIAAQEKRRAAVRTELEILARLAAQMGADHAAPPAPVDAAPDASAPAAV